MDGRRNEWRQSKERGLPDLRGYGDFSGGMLEIGSEGIDRQTPLTPVSRRPRGVVEKSVLRIDRDQHA